MIGAMLFSMINTLLGQPESYWLHPERAMRGDGLSIYDKTNHTFSFFLDHGWQAYLAASLVYLLAAFLAVSILPRSAAFLSIFSFVLGHYFGASNWLAVRWHLGVQGPALYSFVLSGVLVLAAFPAPESADLAVKRLRWVMLGAMVFDFANTLLGQPGSFWHHPETMNESNQLVRLFMAHGWVGYCLFDLFYIPGTFLLVSFLPRKIALVCVFAFTLLGFIGASNWFFYRWRLGMEAPVFYGILLSGIIVLLAFPRNRAANSAPSMGFDEASKL